MNYARWRNVAFLAPIVRIRGKTAVNSAHSGDSPNVDPSDVHERGRRLLLCIESHYKNRIREMWPESLAEYIGFPVVHLSKDIANAFSRCPCILHHRSVCPLVHIGPRPRWRLIHVSPQIFVCRTRTTEDAAGAPHKHKTVNGLWKRRDALLPAPSRWSLWLIPALLVSSAPSVSISTNESQST